MGASRKKVGRALTPAVSNVRQEIQATKEFVAKYQDRVLALMGRDVNRVERFMQTLSQSLAMEPKLAKCTRASLIGGVLEIAALGLEPGVLGQAWLIPFNNKGKLEATVVIGYRGFLELARATDRVGAIAHGVVYEKDYWDWILGTNGHVDHRPSGEDDRGKFVAAWAQADIKGFTRPQFEVMLAREVNAIEKGAPSAKASFSPWKSHRDEMRCKTVIRRLAKMLPMGPAMGRGVTIDEKLDARVSQDLRSHVPDISELPVLGDGEVEPDDSNGSDVPSGDDQGVGQRRESDGSNTDTKEAP